MGDDFEGKFNREMRQGLDSVTARGGWDEPVRGRLSLYGADVRVLEPFGRGVRRERPVPCWLVQFWCGCSGVVAREDGGFVGKRDACGLHRDVLAWLAVLAGQQL